MSTTANQRTDRPTAAGVWGILIGTLGGLIGLGGAEFRLPVLSVTSDSLPSKPSFSTRR